ncbi:hypothetical protein Dshi_3918 (plasmid) [Dinoroseobacter shibae DFL 12 = DSM 16493]|jgi:hypothetical protein|uniref:PRC-barrel domain-containing protein n=1 Tax=Dinoroseobacter shibae (strain DSM 16493 / NCIMB 14021 / DFL 12) TaxID=398580 RepID=A8LTS9_DINSH|nr:MULTISPECIES: PRC-barrel domain-containing protein [Dinoroseobacter]ABV95646.1 hypothetical protein Dshi_3918 [Dinoroseobacter shibae DFL 12 = DSM 16493]MDD9719019.1 PRC-barrel domain-containing protein [Dinoroseobacter sp. PD6]URF48854.1 PRC-barrel domain-containing protein [Dinoroseobacter shibae]URF53166.1 PRC-barrel domain-containing protein [Dinoroseobacter shibae]
MKLLTTSTIALLVTTPMAFADTHNTGEMAIMKSADMYENRAELIRSRDITGGAIYTMNAADDEFDMDDWDANTMYDAVDSEWNEIGEIEDLVLSKDGKVIGIVAEVGGFLDVGDQHVMISVSDMNLVAVDDTTYTYVTRLSEEELEAMEGVDEGFWN